MQKLIYAVLCTAAIIVPTVSHAAVTEKDMQVAGRALGFANNPPSGDVKLGIVYAPGNPASAKDEQDLVALLGSGLKVGNINFIAMPITIDQIGSAAPGIFFLTAGLGADGAKVGAAAIQKKLLCVTTDVAATQAGSCALGIQTDPKVQITVNKAATEASGVSFAAAFKMMITEI